MATEITVNFGFDLVRDTVGEDQGRRILAILQEVLSDAALTFTKSQSAVVPLAASGNTTPAFTADLTDFDLLLVFSTQACTVQLANGGTSIDIAAGGFLLLHTSARTYLKVTMGGTAGTVAYFLAT